MSGGTVKNTCYILDYIIATTKPNYMIVVFERIRLAVTNPLTVRSLNRSTVFRYLHKNKNFNVIPKNYVDFSGIFSSLT